MMTSDTTIIIPEIGPVLFAASSRAKRISITIRPPRHIRVAVPCGVSLTRAQEVVAKKIKWIHKTLGKLAPLVARQEELKKQLAVQKPQEAAKALIHRLEELAEKHGFLYNKFTVRNQKTRWGSCSSANNISINITLAALPDELRDYVLVHELVHTRHHHHQPAFWKALQKILPDTKKLRLELKEYSPGLG